MPATAVTESPWISVAEGLPNPGDRVLVWTNYEPNNLIAGMRSQYSYTFCVGYIDALEGWFISNIGSLRRLSSLGMILKGRQGAELAVEFWMPIPPPPPFLKYPDLRNSPYYQPPEVLAAETLKEGD